MSAPIGPGDWVECVRCQSPAAASAGIRPGGLYCVEAVQDMGGKCRACSACDGVGLMLAGIRFGPRGYLANFMCAGAFRPIYRPKADLIEQLKQPAPGEAKPSRQVERVVSR